MLKGLFGLGRRVAPLATRSPALPAFPIGAAHPAVMVRPEPAPTLARPVELVSGRQPGELLGGVYPVLRRLGQGGFGEVFLCRHPSWNIEVAVKLPNPDLLADPRTLRDLEHEAEEWTDLGLHPYITYCYHLHPIGTLPLLVVEYVPGGTLRDRIEVPEVVTDLHGNLDLAIQLCHALEHAHGHGLIHRDPKPENVLLTADGTVKLTDFGIARRGAVEGVGGALGVARGLGTVAAGLRRRASSIHDGRRVYAARRYGGWTPLLSASKDHPRIGELLLANKANPDLASSRGYTPLMRAAGNGAERIVKLLLAAGSDKRLVDCDGKNAYQLSMEMGQPACAQLVK